MIAGPLVGDPLLPRSLDPEYWPEMDPEYGPERDGIEGTGGATELNSVGRLLNRVEYRRFTRSDVCNTSQIDEVA